MYQLVKLWPRLKDLAGKLVGAVQEPPEEEGPPPDYMELALKLIGEGDYAGAAKALENVIADEKDMGRAYRLLADCYYEMGNTEESRKAFNRAINYQRVEQVQEPGIADDVARWWKGLMRRAAYLWRYKWWAIGVVLLILALVFLEFRTDVWPVLGGYVARALAALWRFRFTSLLVALLLLGLLFGFGWLRNTLNSLNDWRKRHSTISLLIGVLLVVLGIWIYNNWSNWVFLPFKVEKEVDEKLQIEGEDLAVQLTASINSVQDLEVLKRKPQVVKELPDAAGCAKLVQDISFETRKDARGLPLLLKFQRGVGVQLKGTGDSSSTLDLGTFSVSGVNIPTRIFTAFLMRILNPGYREISGQAYLQGTELHLVAQSNIPGETWGVNGPADRLDLLTTYLAYQIAIDLGQKATESVGIPDAINEPRELALALGDLSLRDKNYQKAIEHYQVAIDMYPSYREAHVNMGMAYYLMFLQDPAANKDKEELAIAALKHAMTIDPNHPDPYLYLACIYKRNNDLQLLAPPLFESYVRLSVPPPVATPQIFVQNGTVYLLQSNGRVSIVKEDGTAQGIWPVTEGGELVRKIVAAGDYLLMVMDGGGAARLSLLDGTLTTIMAASRAEGGVRQVAYSNENMYLIDGKGDIWVYRTRQLAPDSEAEGTILRGTPLVKDVKATYMAIKGDDLAFIDEEGTVWRLYPATGEESFPVVLVQDANAVQVTLGKLPPPSETIVSQMVPEAAAPPTPTTDTPSDLVFVLGKEGNITAIYQDEDPDTPGRVLIDDGTNTMQIVADGAELWVLKLNGEVWRVSGAGTPGRDDDRFESIWTSQGNSQVFVEEGVEGVVYVLNERSGVYRKEEDTPFEQVYSFTK